MPNIAKLLWPKSVAIIGASSDTRGLRGRIVQIMRSHPYQGAVYPVSRSETEVQGLKAYKSVAELPPTDLAAMIIPAQFVPQELENCGKAGIKAAIILSSDRKSTRLNSSHDQISYAVFCLKKKKNRKKHWERKTRRNKHSEIETIELISEANILEGPQIE